jgi:hypothetical protein
MAAFLAFYKFTEDLATGGVHDLGADTLKIYLSNATPDRAADAVKADLAEITNQNGYTAPIDTQNAISRTLGVTSVTGVDITLTATGTVGPYRYVVLFNDTAASDQLIGYWDKGAPVTLSNGQTDLFDFGSSLFTISPTA